jgi:hypothetical protein
MNAARPGVNLSGNRFARQSNIHLAVFTTPNSPDLAILFVMDTSQICESKTTLNFTNHLTMKLNFSNLYLMLVIAGLSASCTKVSEAGKQETGAEALGGIGPVAPYTWTELDIPGNSNNYPFNQPWSKDVVAPVGDTYYLWTGTQKERVFRLNKTSLQWEPHPGWKTPADLLFQHKVVFKYQSKVYYSFNNSFDPDFGVLDPVAGTITSLAPFPAPDSIGYYPHTFVVGDNGYIFFDLNHGFWKYNFPTNTWTQLGENPFYGRTGVTIVVAGGKVYGGMGHSPSEFQGTGYQHYHRDWVEFNPEVPGSVAKANFPYYVADDTKTCVIGDNIYVGFGKTYVGTGSVWSYNLFKYDISANRWSECTDYPGLQIALSPLGDYLNTRVEMFSMGSSVYVVAGGIHEFWRYSNQRLITGTN